jgi:Ca2+-binding RTX toxin-like protein
MRRTWITTAALAAALLAPASAGAATLSYEGDTLVYRGDPVADTTMFSAEDDGTLRVASAPTALATPGGCSTPEYSSGVSCPMPAKLRIELGGGNDVPGFSMRWPAGSAIEVLGQDGDDNLRDVTHSEAASVIDGGAGNDALQGFLGNDLLIGGPGNDKIDGHEGDDRLEGGDGDDLLKPDTYKSPGNDVVDGGAGRDEAEDWTIPDGGSHPPANISLDGVANDGRPGEADNVVNVERLHQRVAGTLVGSDGPDDFEIAWNAYEQTMESTLLGHGGDDKLVGNTFRETIDGGAGDDVLEGGFNDDVITGGPGRDRINGDDTSPQCGLISGQCVVPFGSDTVNARDGEADVIDCGPGEDRAVVDAVDTVQNCEAVDKAGAVAGPGTPGTPGGPVATPGAGNARIVGARSLRALTAGRLKVAVPCAAACRVSVQLLADARTARRAGRTLAAGTRTLLAPGTAQVTLKATAKAKRALRRLRGATTTLKVTTTVGGAGAKRTTQTLRLGR